MLGAEEGERSALPYFSPEQGALLTTKFLTYLEYEILQRTYKLIVTNENFYDLFKAAITNEIKKK